MSILLHPLHSPAWVAEYVTQHAQYPGDRCTGRSTAQALRAIADAIDMPHCQVNLIDHSNVRGGFENLNHITQEIVKTLQLNHFHFSRGTHPHGSVLSITFGDPK